MRGGEKRREKEGEEKGDTETPNNGVTAKSFRIQPDLHTARTRMHLNGRTCGGTTLVGASSATLDTAPGASTYGRSSRSVLRTRSTRWRTGTLGYRIQPVADSPPQYQAS
eukprot:3553603-Rhodomonas_salina.1